MPIENQLVVDYFLDIVCRAPLTFPSHLLDGNGLTAINILHISEYLNSKELYNFGFELFEFCISRELSISTKHCTPLSFLNGDIGIYLAITHLIANDTIDFDLESLNEYIIDKIHHHIDNNNMSRYDHQGLTYLIHGYHNYDMLNQNLSVKKLVDKAKQILCCKNNIGYTDFCFPLKMDMYESDFPKFYFEILQFAAGQYNTNIIDLNSKRQIKEIFYKIVGDDLFFSTRDKLFHLNQVILAICSKSSCFDFLYWNAFKNDVTEQKLH
ncbi:hypothetical protein [Sphingobacterium sp. DR205]|uniref:hypothetical protein n=1 Tax=Sphingobacterium sp. DR205 TaxID=2713573 RepID=UPI0013E4F123|nr:hypothetical protein [Sphingobacterium sp. DR205]QIH36743.1 hypothetical protein G6053_29535 [Sphingobacterium sp. DR205]